MLPYGGAFAGVLDGEVPPFYEVCSMCVVNGSDSKNSWNLGHFVGGVVFGGILTRIGQ